MQRVAQTPCLILVRFLRRPGQYERSGISLLKRSFANRYHHLIKTFFGWAEQQLPDGTLILTSPAGQTYVTTPGSALLFPSLCYSVGGMPAPEADPRPQDYCAERAAMMPKRRRTRPRAGIGGGHRTPPQPRRPPGPANRNLELPRPRPTTRRRRSAGCLPGGGSGEEAALAGREDRMPA